MSGKTVNSAILVLVIGNAMALISDVFIKLLEPGAPVFQFAFLRCFLTLIMLLPLWRQVERSRLFEGMGTHLLRAHIHLAVILCMVVALVSLLLATANAVFYAAPILVMLLSVLIFRERLSLLNLSAVVSGFVGILVILRPVELGWGALAALGSALVILGYNITVLLAYRQIDACQVTSAEYTGLIWAVLIGWIGFNEMPDLWFAVGNAMIVVPLILVGLRSRQRSHRMLRVHPMNG
jgi:drug/metabolite transporter (DMT)-like permease